MNWDQGMSLLRILLAAGGPVTVLWTRLGISPDQANAFDNALLTLVGVSAPVAVGVWGLISNRWKNKVATVSQIPGIVHIAVDPNKASPAIVAAALDRDQPKIKLISEVKT